MHSHLMHTYSCKDVAFVRGEGAWLWDENNKRYLDALSGIAVCGLGHAHPKLVEALHAQSMALWHTSNVYRIQQQERLGAKLCELAGMDRVFFGNSGAEANEAAIKIARLHGHKKGINDPAIVVFENSFHGRTMATLSATANRKAHAGFEPLVGGFVRAPYDDADAVKKICTANPNVCAIFVEPIQGEGGIRIPGPDYLAQLRAVCDEFDCLLILDEIQSGNARSGQWFAYQHTAIYPDVITTAKGLGNGFPIGACLARGMAADLFAPGSHGSTFGGNPLACATAYAVLNSIEQEELLDNARKIGRYLLQELSNKLGPLDVVKQVRGLGLLLAVELTKDCPQLVDIAMDKGLLINVTAGNVIRLLPPLVIDEAQADQIAALLLECINEFSQNEHESEKAE